MVYTPAHEVDYTPGDRVVDTPGYQVDYSGRLQVVQSSAATDTCLGISPPTQTEMEQTSVT